MKAGFRTIAIAILALGTFAAAADAQQAVMVRRGMLGIMHEGIPVNNARARQRVVVDVVKGSPAEKAGLVPGDTILSINGLPASSQVMSVPLEPGDSVVLRIRREGRERDVRLVAAENSNVLYAATVLPDTISRRIAIIMDEMSASVDTVYRNMVRFRAHPDSTTFELHGDSMHVYSFPRGDSVRVFSFREPLRAMGEHIEMQALLADSMHGHLREAVRVLTGDSMQVHLGGALRILTGDSMQAHLGEVAGIMRDSLHMTRPAGIFAAGLSVGMRAVAGAELSELNESLATYFGTGRGVLVLNAHEGTPAARAGLRGGDVILQVNGEGVTTIRELRRAIEEARGETQLRVLRAGRNVDIRLER